MYLYQALGKATWARILASCRRQAPILPILIPVFVGSVAADQILLGSAQFGWALVAILIFLFGLSTNIRGVISCLLLQVLAFLLTYSTLPPILPDIAYSEVSLVAQVAEAPRHRRPQEIELGLKILGQFESNNLEYTKWSKVPLVVCKASFLPWKNIYNVEVGSTLVMRAKVNRIDWNSNSPLSSYSASRIRQGYSGTCRIIYSARPELAQISWLQDLRYKVVQSVYNVLGSNERAGLLLATSIGTRDVISYDTISAFKRTGLAHLLVVSGCQVTLIYYLFFIILRFLLVRTPRLPYFISAKTLSSILATLAALGFVALIGLEGASIRAALSLLFVVCCLNLERGGGLLNSILVSLFIMLLIWPGCIISPGLQLSYSALLGIWVGAGLSKNKIYQFVLVNLCASLFTSIITLAWFDQLSPIGFLLNPIMAPLISCLGCYIGIPSVGLLLLDIDQHGILVSIISAQLIYLRDLVEYFSTISFSYLMVTGGWKVLFMSVLGVVAMFAMVRSIESRSIRCLTN